MSPVVLLYKDNNGKKCVKFDENCVMKREKCYSFSSFEPNAVYHL